MIRFYDNQVGGTEDIDVVMATESIMFGKNIWNDGKKYFKQNISFDPAVIRLLPVEDEKHETICYAYQDREANRELRMLRELNKYEEAIQFSDVFPEIQNVTIYGCNELAYYFALYLKKQQINVSVLGKYWDLFGYENNRMIDFESKRNMIIYAEEIQYRDCNLYQTVIRSASPGFECIDQIYEANVLAGKIHDTIGDFADVLEKIRGKEIVILGTDTVAQDTYDLLYGHGIDICCFAEAAPPEKGEYGTLLGKKVLGIEESVKSKDDRVFIDSIGKNSALGTGIVNGYDVYGYKRTGNVDVFDYYGYERNEQFFLIRDYTDIPCSCLTHVLNGKKVFLAGDERLCSILSDYLLEVEQGNVETEYIDISLLDIEETDILCIVYLWYDDVIRNPRLCAFLKELSVKKVSYTDYFANIEAFVSIDLFMNRDISKYSVKELIPKGVLLGKIPPTNGNIFIRGLLDDHPNILQWGYTGLCNNLFLYCIRLAAEKSENILPVFMQLYCEETEAKNRDSVILSKAFEERLIDLLSLKENFTSQELFMLFHIAYAEVFRDEKVTDLYDRMIYWEPHGCPRDKFSFLAKWLDDYQITGQTLIVHRDITIWAGLNCKYFLQNPESRPDALYVIECMSRDHWIEPDHTSYRNWKEFRMRFEDIKLHPKEELMKICDACGIPWSITMLSTTNRGKPWSYNGNYDFDLKPVFNRYDEYLSEFDHFKISLISSPYQKKYGYPYENCMRFTRRELQEMFLKEFRFQETLPFSNEKDRKAYLLRAYALLGKHLWIMRRHTVLDDIVPEFGKLDFANKKIEEVKHDRETVVNEIEKLVSFVKKQKRLILYGMGRDCEGLLKRLDETEQSEILFCDKKAEYMDIVFHGRKVLAPEDLCDVFNDYIILITSSLYYQSIQGQLENLGISSERIVCNKVQLWEDEK